ncbi:MAG: Gfo/Idh/MocA family oxidoreductase [Methanobrevibacter sp.]
MKDINVGVIGVGAMGYNHARVYYKLENANLIAVSDVSEMTLEKVSKKYDAKAYTDYNDLLEDPEIEVVSVCVPTTHHHDVVMSAIEHGKHVLVEKPIAFTLEEAEEMIEAAHKKGVILGTGHVERFNPAVQKAKELIDNDVIGDIVSASAKRVGPYPPRIKDVGVAIDLAIHDLDIMYYLFNQDVKRVYASMGSILNNCEYEDHAEIMVNFAGGMTGMLEVNWLTPYKRREISITGTDGIINVDYIDQSIDVRGKFAQDIQIEHKEPLMEELRSFLNAVTENKKPVITGEDGLNALKMVIAANRSSKTKKPITLEELEDD